MLTDHIDRYVALRQAFGYRLRKTARRLHAFARFADAKGDNTHIRTSTAVAWATDAPSPGARHIRLRDVVHLDKNFALCRSLEMCKVASVAAVYLSGRMYYSNSFNLLSRSTSSTKKKSIKARTRAGSRPPCPT
jgi:hypothetical protein